MPRSAKQRDLNGGSTSEAVVIVVEGVSCSADDPVGGIVRLGWSLVRVSDGFVQLERPTRLCRRLVPQGRVVPDIVVAKATDGKLPAGIADYYGGSISIMDIGANSLGLSACLPSFICWNIKGWRGRRPQLLSLGPVSRCLCHSGLRSLHGSILTGYISDEIRMSPTYGSDQIIRIPPVKPCSPSE
jgi:hypothetical protein